MGAKILPSLLIKCRWKDLVYIHGEVYFLTLNPSIRQGTHQSPTHEHCTAQEEGGSEPSEPFLSFPSLPQEVPSPLRVE